MVLARLLFVVFQTGSCNQRRYWWCFSY